MSWRRRPLASATVRSSFHFFEFNSNVVTMKGRAPLAVMTFRTRDARPLGQAGD